MESESTIYKIIVCNKPHVLASFFMEISKLSEFLQCRIKVVEKSRKRNYPLEMNFWPVALGEIMELQITIPDRAPRVVLEMIESLISQQFGTAGFSCN